MQRSRRRMLATNLLSRGRGSRRADRQSFSAGCSDPPARMEQHQMKVARRNLNLVVLAMLVVMGVVLGYVIGIYRTEYRFRPYLWRGNSELEALAARYGSARHSKYGEEWIVRDFFEDRRGGVFVDVGANHYQRDSNTYYLESQLGWSGLAIEPQTKFAADYRAQRPLTTFVPL